MRKVSIKTATDSSPQAAYVDAVLRLRTRRLRDAMEDRDVGASAIELAIITAILVGLAVGVLIVVTTIVNQRRTEIQTKNNGIP